MKNTENLILSVQTKFVSSETWQRKQVYGPGSRPHYLLYAVAEGKGLLQLKNRLHYLQAGDVFFLSPGTEMYLEADEYTPWKLIWTAFSGEEAADVLQKQVFASSPVFHVEKGWERFLSCGEHLVDVFCQEASSSLEITGALVQWISHLIPKTGKKRAGKREEHLAKAKAYIDENYCYDIRIMDIAHQIGIDRSYVYRLFIEKEHIAPKDYLLKLRLEHAKAMMEAGVSPVKAAFSCGFSDPSSLNYHFTNRYGLSADQFAFQVSSCVHDKDSLPVLS